ncbi:hypothetical protein PR048_016697 [Dryococelus australis]|uniref:Uncharacterized protein n=1 Tax=Dryococelus australis TaxID=614101 RepID=A0ABQ9H7E9_9NEOP|nr:hypothetical protein PR048_016697 [Dryococelus australis]
MAPHMAHHAAPHIAPHLTSQSWVWLRPLFLSTRRSLSGNLPKLALGNTSFTTTICCAFRSKKLLASEKMQMSRAGLRTNMAPPSQVKERGRTTCKASTTGSWQAGRQSAGRHSLRPAMQLSSNCFPSRREKGLNIACCPPPQDEPGSIPGRVTGFFKVGRCRWSAGFLGAIPIPPPFHSGATPFSPQSTSKALKTSLLGAGQISSLPFDTTSGGPVAWGRGLVLTAVSKQHAPGLILGRGLVLTAVSKQHAPGLILADQLPYSSVALTLVGQETRSAILDKAPSVLIPRRFLHFLQVLATTIWGRGGGGCDASQSRQNILASLPHLSTSPAGQRRGRDASRDTSAAVNHPRASRMKVGNKAASVSARCRGGVRWVKPGHAQVQEHTAPAGPVLALHQAVPGPCSCVMPNASPCIIKSGRAGPGPWCWSCVPGLTGVGGRCNLQPFPCPAFIAPLHLSHFSRSPGTASVGPSWSPLSPLSAPVISLTFSHLAEVDPASVGETR